MNLLEHSMHTNFFSPEKYRATAVQATCHQLLQKQLSCSLSPVEVELLTYTINAPQGGALLPITNNL